MRPGVGSRILLVSERLLRSFPSVSTLRRRTRRQVTWGWLPLHIAVWEVPCFRLLLHKRIWPFQVPPLLQVPVLRSLVQRYPALVTAPGMALSVLAFVLVVPLSFTVHYTIQYVSFHLTYREERPSTGLGTDMSRWLSHIKRWRGLIAIAFQRTRFICPCAWLKLKSQNLWISPGWITPSI